MIQQSRNKCASHISMVHFNQSLREKDLRSTNFYVNALQLAYYLHLLPILIILETSLSLLQMVLTINRNHILNEGWSEGLHVETSDDSSRIKDPDFNSFFVIHAEFEMEHNYWDFKYPASILDCVLFNG